MSAPHIEPRRLAGLAAFLGGQRLRQAREPVFELGVEAVLRLAGLEVEKTEDERAREAEERGREGNAHAAQGRRQARLQVLEQAAEIALADIERLDDAPDGPDGLLQAPEGAQEAEEDQEAHHVAQDVAALVEARAHRIEE